MKPTARKCAECKALMKLLRAVYADGKKLRFVCYAQCFPKIALKWAQQGSETVRFV